MDGRETTTSEHSLVGTAVLHTDTCSYVGSVMNRMTNELSLSLSTPFEVSGPHYNGGTNSSARIHTHLFAGFNVRMPSSRMTLVSLRAIGCSAILNCHPLAITSIGMCRGSCGMRMQTMLVMVEISSIGFGKMCI